MSRAKEAHRRRAAGTYSPAAPSGSDERESTYSPVGSTAAAPGGAASAHVPLAAAAAAAAAAAVAAALKAIQP